MPGRTLLRMALRVEKISAVTFRVRDMRASVQFYRDVLGMEVLCGGEDAPFSSLHANDGSAPILNLEQGRSVTGRGCAMAYYKVRIEVWCDWNPAESDLDDIAQSMGVGEAICTMREVVAVVNRPQDIEDEEAMSFFGGSEGDADESQG